MLLAALPLAAVGAGTAVPSPIFDLDLSGYNASSTDSAKGIKDKASDTVTETFTVPANVSITDATIGTKTVKAMNVSSSSLGIDVKDSGVDTAASGTSMTVESWMKVDASGGHALLYSTPSNAHNWQIMLDKVDANNKNVTFVTKLHNNDSYKTSEVTAEGSGGSWAHYVFTRAYTESGCTQKLFVNGVLQKEYTSAVTSPQTVTSGIMYLGGGSYAGGGIAMNGSIASFKVYSEALSAEQVRAAYDKETAEDSGSGDPSGSTDPDEPVSSDLVFGLDLSAGTVKNSVTGTNAGITVGSGTQIITVTGTETKALDIGSAGVSVADSAVKQAAASSYTAEWWAKSDAAALGGWMASFRNDSGKYGFKTCPDGSAKWLTEQDNTGNVATRVNIPYTDYSDWTHFAIAESCDSTTGSRTVTVYVNGTAAGTRTYTITPYTDYTLHIGQAYAGMAVYPGLITSFKVYNKALDAAAVQKNYNDTKGDFVSKAVDFSSVSPAGGTAQASAASLEPLAGSFTLNFDNTVSSSAESLAAITLEKITDEGRKPVKVSAAASDKKVTVAYGTLDELSDYVLTIGADFASSWDVKLGKSYSFYYKTTAMPDMTFLDVDFSADQYVVGEKPTGDDGLTYMSTGVTGSKDNFKIQTVGGKKCLTYSVSKTDVAASSQLLYEFDKNVSGRSMVFELGIRGYVDGSDKEFGLSAREVMRVNGNNQVTVMDMGRDNSKNLISQGGSVSGSFASTPGSDGFNKLKIVIQQDASGYYLFDVYDQNGTGYSRLVPADNLKLSYIKKVMFAHIYPLDNTKYGQEGIAISYVKGYYAEHPRLDSVNSDFKAEDGTLKLFFNKEMDAAAMAKGVYTLKDSEKNAIALSFSSYDSAQKCVTLTLSDHLSAGGSYTITADGVLDKDGIPVAAADALSFTVPAGAAAASQTGAAAGGSELTSLSQLSGSAAAISFSYTPQSGAGENLIVFSQHFDKDGYLKKLSRETITLQTSDIGRAKSHTLDSATYAEGDYVMFYIWRQGADGKYQPVLTAPYKLTY